MYLCKLKPPWHTHSLVMDHGPWHLFLLLINLTNDWGGELPLYNTGKGQSHSKSEMIENEPNPNWGLSPPTGTSFIGESILDIREKRLIDCGQFLRGYVASSGLCRYLLN